MGGGSLRRGAATLLLSPRTLPARLHPAPRAQGNQGTGKGSQTPRAEAGAGGWRRAAVEQGSRGAPGGPQGRSSSWGTPQGRACCCRGAGRRSCGGEGAGGGGGGAGVRLRRGRQRRVGTCSGGLGGLATRVRELWARGPLQNGCSRRVQQGRKGRQDSASVDAGTTHGVWMRACSLQQARRERRRGAARSQPCSIRAGQYKCGVCSCAALHPLKPQHRGGGAAQRQGSGS